MEGPSLTRAVLLINLRHQKGLKEKKRRDVCEREE